MWFLAWTWWSYHLTTVACTARPQAQSYLGQPGVKGGFAMDGEYAGAVVLCLLIHQNAILATLQGTHISWEIAPEFGVAVMLTLRLWRAAVQHGFPRMKQVTVQPWALLWTHGGCYVVQVFCF